MNEKAKSVVLFALFGLMIVLFYISLTMGLQGVGQGFGMGLFFGNKLQNDPAGDIEEEKGYRAAAMPLKVAVRGETGLYVPQIATESEESYKQIEPILNEAIGSMGEIENITRQQYLEGFLQPSVFVEYDMQVPLYMLRMWAGFGYAVGDDSLSKVLLCQQEGEVLMYFVDDKTGGYRRAKTAAAPERLEQVCASTTVGNGFYAFENAEFEAFEPDVPVYTGTLKMPVYSVMPPAFADTGEVSRQTLQAFGLNPYLTNIYEDADKSMVYVEDYKALSMSSSGNLTFTANSGEGIFVENIMPHWSQAEKVANVVEFTRRIAIDIWEKAQGGGSLSMDSIKQTETGYDITFEISLNGYFIAEGREAAVSVKIEENRITYMKLRPRRYVQNGEKTVLPMRQAAAALAGTQSIRPIIRYLDQGNGNIAAQPTYVK